MVLYLLGCFLEPAQHGALTAGEVFSHTAVLTDFSEYLLHDDELIRHKRIVLGKFLRTAKALDIQNGVRKAKEITQHGIIFVVECFQLRSNFRLFLQNTLLNNLVHRGRREGQTGLKARLDTGKLIGTHLDNFINGFLSGADYPHRATAFTSDLLCQRLEVQKHIGIRADILAGLVHHEQKSEVFRLTGNICLDVIH